MKIPEMCVTCKAKHTNKYEHPCVSCHLIPKHVEDKTYWLPNNYEVIESIVEI